MLTSVSPSPSSTLSGMMMIPPWTTLRNTILPTSKKMKRMTRTRSICSVVLQMTRRTRGILTTLRWKRTPLWTRRTTWVFCSNSGAMGFQFGPGTFPPKIIPRHTRSVGCGHSSKFARKLTPILSLSAP